MNQQFREIIQPGSKAVERLIFPSHPAISAVFAAKIGHFHYAAKEDPPTEPATDRLNRARVQPLLIQSTRMEQVASFRKPI
jgi:hypothetical protein